MPDKEEIEHREGVAAEETTHRTKIAEETMRRATMLVALQEITQQQSDNIGRLVSSVERLAEVVETKASRRDVFSITSLINLVTLLVVSAMFFTILRNQSNSRVLLHNGNDTLALMQECVTPGPNPPPKTGNDCYDRTLASQAGAILTLDCANESVIRYYISSIPGLVPPPIRPQCAEILKGSK